MTRVVKFRKRLIEGSLFLGLTTIAVLGAFGQDVPYSISGRVVDAQGRLVKDPEVYFFPEEGSNGNPNSPATSDWFGNFHDRLSTNAAQVPKWRLYIGYPPCGSGALILSPPFDWLNKQDERFAGMPLLIGDKRDIKLGDVLVQYRYSTAILDLSELKRWQADIPWLDIFLQVRTASGKRVSLGTFNSLNVKAFVDKERSTIQIEIPEGRWSFDIVLLNNERDPGFELVIASSNTVDIKDGEARPTVHFRLLEKPVQQYDGLKKDAKSPLVKP